jgi:MinD superfamily P-loop ATPase
MVGKLPYDNVMTKAMIQEQSVIEFSDGELSHEIHEMWNRIQEVL